MLSKSTVAFCSLPVARRASGTSTGSIPVPWAPAGGWQRGGGRSEGHFISMCLHFCLGEGVTSRLCKPSAMLMGAAGWLHLGWFLPSQSQAREHLWKGEIKKPGAVYFEDSVFAFTSCWRELLCYCQQINKIRALF